MTEAAFETLYQGEQRPPWDRDEPSEFVVELHRGGHFRGSVLDVGCGTGENALYLASSGFEVVALDAAPTAIARAREKARARGARDVTFERADARELEGYVDRFDTVLDSGLFHVFAEEGDRNRYVAALHRACRAGAVVHLLCFSEKNSFVFDDRFPRPSGCGTHEVDEAELRRAFARGWTFESLSPLVYTADFPGQGQQEKHFWLARIRRSA